jgi:hypothetical protein
MLIEAAASQSHGDDESSGDDKDDGDQLSLDSLIKPADWPAGKNWGTLSIDASCTPADITYPTDLKLLNVARQSTERVIDDLWKQGNAYGVHRPRYVRGKARAHFLNVAKQKRPRWRRLKAAVRRQLSYLQRNLEAIDALIADGAAFQLSRSIGGISSSPAVSSTGSKPFCSTARPGASLIALSIWCSGTYGPLFVERQGLLLNSEPQSVFLLAMDLHSCIGSAGMPTTKARI